MFSFRTTALEDQLDKALLDGRVGCFCTQNCWDTAHGRYMYDLFTERGNLKAVFSPMGAELTPGTNHISFDAEALTELDAIVVEIQDAGARYFNYTKNVFHLMVILAAMENPPSLYIVDHINPAGRIVEGSMPSGTVEPHTPKIAHRHGLTLGELCDLWYNEIGATFALHVISALASDSTRQLLPWTIAQPRIFQDCSPARCTAAAASGTTPPSPPPSEQPGLMNISEPPSSGTTVWKSSPPSPES